MPKTFNDHCPVSRTLAIVGERWTMQILRDLLVLGPRRFQDLQRNLAEASPNTLSARLKTLEAAGLVTRRLYAEHPPRAEYLLTEKGRALAPAIQALRAWGETYLPTA